MKTIRQRSDDYIRSTGALLANYVEERNVEDAFLAGAASVIEELKMVMSVSEEQHLRTNLGKMINYLEGGEHE